MFELKEIDEKLDDLQKTFNWLISGLGIHGLKISDAHIIDWKWVCENYNVGTHKCKHNKVSDIGYVVSFGDTSENLYEKFYDGFCEACKKTVHGRTKLDNTPIERWK